MKATEAAAALKAHLAKHGFGDIEVNVTGGYDPTTTPMDALISRAEKAVYNRAGIDPIEMRALPVPGPVTCLPASRSKCPQAISALVTAMEPTPRRILFDRIANPKVCGMDGAALSHVEYLYELAATK